MNASHCSPADIRLPPPPPPCHMCHPLLSVLPRRSFPTVTWVSHTFLFLLLAFFLLLSSRFPPAPLVLHLNLFFAPLIRIANLPPSLFLLQSPSSDLALSSPPRPFPPLLLPLVFFLVLFYISLRFSPPPLLLPRLPTQTQLNHLCRRVRVARPRHSFLSPPLLTTLPKHTHTHTNPESRPQPVETNQ